MTSEMGVGYPPLESEDVVAQKKKIRAGKDPVRRNDRQKNAKIKKVMALRTHDAVKRQPLKSIVPKARPNSVRSIDQAQTVSDSEIATPINKHAEPASPTVVVAAAHGPQTLFEDQMQVFAALLKWSPVGMIIRQQALVADMMFNLHYPKKPVPTLFAG